MCRIADMQPWEKVVLSPKGHDSQVEKHCSRYLQTERSNLYLPFSNFLSNLSLQEEFIRSAIPPKSLVLNGVFATVMKYPQ